MNYNSPEMTDHSYFGG